MLPRRRPPAPRRKKTHRVRIHKEASKNTMADDPNKRGPQDRTRINVNEPHEVRYWTQTLGVTEAQLRSAVAAAGVEVKDVRVYLGKP